MKLVFDVMHPYYLPQYLPVAREWMTAGHQAELCLHGDLPRGDRDLEAAIESGLTLHRVNGQSGALAYYKQSRPEWVVFGNRYDAVTQLKGVSKTALMEHGIGPKSVYYTASESDFDVRFVEGQYRLERLQQMYPHKTFVDTGYAKLDPLMQGREPGLDLASLGLDPNKPTLLYAPTFYPSSIEMMSWDWPQQFQEYNLLLKPHYFSLEKPKYQAQRDRLLHWAKQDNVYLASMEESNLLPFMHTADLLISEASSSLFEFAALDKPIVWCDFLKLRWSYRGIFHYRWKKRMDPDFYRYADIAAHAKHYSELKAVVDQQIAQPNQFQSIRQRHIAQLAGVIDGKASERIVDYLIRNPLSGK
ncbi:CDP-glycerol glycerophosphotransferase family protein [Ferrimonas marina]|uniref:CDP-Glycerol:Poly(Glycerophosphate) glycerophosphotransferase n=1 Tax=Ferrimonas marina TaxID=299255 RepID=A0A1M5ZA47_9GAMM|nr:CDP-glycerol glycerophosphotransferase family protein [Ferrimonas marina]SHI21008.1 CDP-Glycerol:Poly(glycerophosphate) glycerophosphotransferase [Ferrimonas marina]